MIVQHTLENNICRITLQGILLASELPKLKRIFKSAIQQHVCEVWINCAEIIDVELPVLINLTLYQHILQENRIALLFTNLTPYLHNLLVKNHLDVAVSIAESGTTAQVGKVIEL
ncbi:hypothetical protein [Pontibacter oryzae]|uniref:STAS domain-containing protein n=1 Tax=Pontibacter oryzae TaxID=2304593 RepID=A0A399SIW8_9BACT|nr:hypothetical protein [Pontibacter oryzae]RIJ42433.1 hypothetical protein D1627_00750 [Pontibacter oryzae]